MLELKKTMSAAVIKYKEALISRFEPASRFKRKYLLNDKPLGAGHFSKVYKSKPAKGGDEEYAVKIVQMKKLQKIEEVKALENEISILTKVEHPGIIKLYDVYSNANEIWLVEELVTGGELFQRIISRSESGLYTEQEAASIVKNIVKVLEYLHGMKIVHRDIKPENILLRDKDSETRTKLADFGFAAYCNKPLNDPYGTPVYVAPEILVGEPYTTTPDMWSIGIITYILLCGYPPFFHSDQETLAKMIVRTGFKFDPEDWNVVSEDGKNFIRGLLRKNPRKRMTAAKALEHPWLLNYGTKGKTLKKYLTVNTELKKFRAQLNLVKAFGAIRAFEKIKKLAELTKAMDLKDTGSSSPKSSKVRKKKKSSVSQGSGHQEYDLLLAASKRKHSRRPSRNRRRPSRTPASQDN